MITLKLTPRQAAMIHILCDMQIDTGHCKGGNTKREAAAMEQIDAKLMKVKDRWYDTLSWLSKGPDAVDD